MTIKNICTYDVLVSCTVCACVANSVRISLFAEDSLNLCSELEATTKVFEDFIEIYLKKKDLLSLRMVNDVKMMFDKLFIIYRKG